MNYFIKMSGKVMVAIRLRIISLSASACNDRNCEPSVNRTFLKNHDLSKSQKSPNDCVVSLNTSDVRSERIEKSGTNYALNVLPKPEKDNIAHAFMVAGSILAAKPINSLIS